MTVPTPPRRHSRPVATYVIAIPLVVASLQLGGCFARPVPPPPPGGTYLSASAGANFDQSVNRTDAEGYIAAFTLGHVTRPAHSPQMIYIAAGADDIVVSDNGGQSWAVIATPLSYVFDIAALENGTLVASGTDSGGQGYVVRSLDGAKSWEIVLTIPVPEKKQNLQLIKTKEAEQTAAVVLAIEVDPFDPDRIYAGSNVGDLYIGEQSAKTWRLAQTITFESVVSVQNQQRLATHQLIPSPHRPGEVYVITVTGALYRLQEGTQEVIRIPQDVSTRPSSVRAAKKVYSVSFVPDFSDALFVGTQDGAVVSRDNGQTWTQLPIPISTTQQFNTSVVAVSPTNPARLLVAINEVVYRSEDGGETWNTFSLGLGTHNITSLLIDPTNAARVLAITSPVSS